MKLIKRILIIDDRDQENVLDQIHAALGKEFDLHTKFVHTTKPQYRQNDSVKLDFEKLKNAIVDAYSQEGWFELVLTDFDLNEKGNVDGLDVVEYIKSIHLTAPIMMYSGNFSDAVKKIVKTEGTLNDQQVAEAVTKLVGYNIQFPKRNDYRTEAINYLRGEKEISLRNEFLKLLYEHKDMEFNSCYPNFAGKKFDEIARMLENNSDSRSEEWMLALIQQTVAYLVKINEL
ncbi:hypothetical protein [Parabacteroides sp. ZJ-118]|uniref:hypothetical protein n=1 Tax=Parabacteroides sp. ZJ-118 TaxID=2709398 RepID=UPI0013ECAB98|nr:hypothetical protein [Parabacteroides sp. ZJ-118]